MPPDFGVSPAAAGAVSATAPRSAAGRASLVHIVPSCSTILFVEPHRRQILVQIMAGADLPALHICAVGNNTVVPEQKYFVSLAIENMLLEIAHQGPLLRELGFMQHPIVQLDLRRVVELSVARDVDRGRQISLHVEQ